MRMGQWKRKHWALLTAEWFIGTFGVFFLSEKFRNVDAVHYPCVFLFILSMLLGPGAIGAMLPLPKNADQAALRRAAPFLTYVACYLAEWGLAHLCFWIGIL